MSPPGGLKGSSGIIGLERPGDERLLAVVWPFPEEEIGDVTIFGQEDGLLVHFQTDLAGEPAIGTSLSTTIHLDLLRASWNDALDEIPEWLEQVGVRKPDSSPGWVAGARIYEAQIGFSTFAGGWHYSPYSTADDLLKDLDRIQDLGFNTLQIMPQHPFPSYNVFDYRDVSTSWGQIDVLRAIIQTCHERGMRVIFDILLHGVVDKEAVTRAADAVRRGPYYRRIGEATSPLWKGDGDNYHVAYSRHIIDFEPYWSGGSAERHPLVAEHPEWFGRSRDGMIIGMYTKSFDNGHPAWQKYFIDACTRLVVDLDIDGFRFDAPTFNYFANWTYRARAHASTSMLGSVPMFRHLRRVLKRIKPEVMLYTEPSGVLLRQDMDVTYNYDEQWLFGALYDGGDPDDQEAITAQTCATWLNERDAALPRGALTAHHIDSHDTFWWELPGHKWLRELYDVPRTRALMYLFALRPGPYMTFTGGEEGIEAALRDTLHLKAQRPELQRGVARSVDVGHADVYAVETRHKEHRSLVMVNLSGDPALFAGEVEASDTGDWTIADLLGKTVVRASAVDGSAASLVRLSGLLEGWTAAVVPLPPTRGQEPRWGPSALR
ncbi:alpha-amylase family glycosyl hydrolase [Leifsonia sp. AG29]|uniref:alpha-amylase family glycosyl hydrolase n=1 Tax=Leifsonia sp. AG29 TaxID=2598860 RepID=UPI00131D668C|nr:alpha-amylase family glycosyl hydrolase [Leifsonia sp. AG29]